MNQPSNLQIRAQNFKNLIQSMSRHNQEEERTETHLRLAPCHCRKRLFRPATKHRSLPAQSSDPASNTEQWLPSLKEGTCGSRTGPAAVQSMARWRS
ncbi:hypothetical protein ACLB2K_031843 [Fragaria x ananassa]